MLMQQGHPIAFISKTLSPTHHAKSAYERAYERELFAILFAVKKWSHYSQGQKFVIKTNHHNLKFLLEQKLHTPLQHAW